MDRVLLSLCGPREIEVAAEPVGNGKIRLLDAPEHFLIELFLEWLGGLQNGMGIGIFGLQIGDDVGVFFAAEPSVMVNPAVTVQKVFYGLAPGDRRLDNCAL